LVVRLFSVIQMKVCPSTYPSDAVLSFCGQVFDDAKIFCFLSFMLVILIYFSLNQGSALPPLRSLVVLWLLLTSHGKLYSVLHTLFPHVHETSRGKINNLHPISPPHLHSGVRIIFGL